MYKVLFPHDGLSEMETVMLDLCLTFSALNPFFFFSFLFISLYESLWSVKLIHQSVFVFL